MPVTNYPDGINTSDLTVTGGINTVNLTVSDTADIANLTVSDLIISELSALELVATDVDKKLVSIPYSSNNVANNVAIRDSSGNCAFGNLTANTLSINAGANFALNVINTSNVNAQFNNTASDTIVRIRNLNNNFWDFRTMGDILNYRINDSSYMNVDTSGNIGLNNLSASQLLFLNSSKVISGSTPTNGYSPVWNSGNDDFDWVTPTNILVANRSGVSYTQLNTNYVVVGISSGRQYRLIDFLFSVDTAFTSTSTPNIIILDLVSQNVIATIPFSLLTTSHKLINLLTSGVNYNSNILFGNPYASIVFEQSGTQLFTAGSCSIKITYEII